MAGLRVGLDARALKTGPAGVATYVRELLQRLDLYEPFGAGRPRNNFLWNQWWGTLGPLARGCRVFHAPGYTGPLVHRAKLVLSVHDVSYLRGPEFYPYHLDPVRLAYYRASLRSADRILVPSSFSEAELLTLAPFTAGRVRKIPLGVSGDFFPDPDGADAVRRTLDLPDRFALHVGDIHPRRNLPLLIRASARAGLPLVLVGRILAGSAAELSGVRRLEGVSRENLRALYSAASVFVYASSYEGFGLPVAEAMACGLPVVAVPRASVPEVCGDAALLVEATEEAIAEGVEAVLEDPVSWRQKGVEQASRFSWERTAEATLAVYREVVS